MNHYKKGCLAAVASAVAAFAYLQLLLMPQMRSCLLEQAGITIPISTIKSCLNAPLLAAAIALFILATAAVFLGFWKGCFKEFYSWLEHKNKEWALVAAVVAAAALPYLSKGNVLLGDAMQFSALSTYMKESILHLSYPYWTFNWYMGSAPLAFYGWLSFIVTGIANLFVSIDAANKMIFFTAHIGSALLAYKLVKAATGNAKAAVISALVYGLSFEHIARIMVGRSLTALTYLITPLLFLAYELRLNDKVNKYRFIAAIAVIASLLIFNHQADAVFILAVFGFYALAKAVETRKIRVVAAELISAGLIAAAITSFWTVPMLLESGEASAAGKAVEIFTPSLPQLNAVKELVSWPGRWGDKPFYYIGISSLLLGLIGMIYTVKCKKIAAAATTSAAILLLLFQSSRYMPATLLMLAVSAGYGLEYLSKKLKINGTTLLLIIALVMIADMVPATMQLGYPAFSYNKQFYDTIRANDGERILDLSTDRRTFWPSFAYVNNNAETVFGTLIESAPKSFSYAAAISEKAAIEYYDRREAFSGETLQGLYLLGAKYVIVHTEQAGKSPQEVFAGKKGALGLERGLEIIKLQHALIISSPKLQRINYTPQLENMEGWKIRAEFEQRSIPTAEVDAIIKSMNLNTKTGMADAILVKEEAGQTIAARDNPTIKVKKAVTASNKAAAEYQTNGEAFLQLSYSYSQHLSVKIDGKETPYWKTAIDTIAVKTKAGAHTITIEGKQSAQRKGLLAASGAAIALAAYLFRKKKQ